MLYFILFCRVIFRAHYTLHYGLSDLLLLENRHQVLAVCYKKLTKCPRVCGLWKACTLSIEPRLANHRPNLDLFLSFSVRESLIKMK